MTLKSHKWAALLLVLGTMMSSCSWFEFSPMAADVPAEQYHEQALARLRQHPPPTDTTCFVLTGDTQRFFDEATDFVASVNQQPNVQFVIHAGDLTDFGIAWEYRQMHALLSKLRVPYLAVIGNHDLLANGPTIYNRLYGPTDFSFLYGGHKFIFLDTNGREYGFERNIPNLDWLRQELTTDTAAFTDAVVVGHVPPFDFDFDPRFVDPYREVLAASGRVRLSMHGHKHGMLQYGDYFSDGMTYLLPGGVEKRTYAVVKLWTGGQSMTRVTF
jgi:3',5'-cyclic-AMP phosphodiesterase